MTDSSALQPRLDLVVGAARALVNTQWHHAGRLPGVGVDCVGILVLSAQASNYQLDDILHYSRYPDGDVLLNELRAQFDEVPIADRRVGDVLVFTFKKRSRVPQHVGIMTPIGMVHAFQDIKKVCEHSLDDVWIKRLTHVFRWRDNRWLP